MQRIFLKPTAQEIIIKGSSKDGRTDVFRYDYYDDDSKRKLGGLFIVGNVRQEGVEAENENAPNVAYVTNLVASLAKREYYSRPEISPRDAFSATLKKINDVVEEFFKNKDIKINLGIFAVAGEQIFISKLGKFKIILSRPARAGEESRTVDILNNVDLFDKEQVQEKEFSNIISGKIIAGDKLFAFYPNRLVTAREKAIKASLLKFNRDEFVEKINSIRETKPDFECGALYLSLNNHKEPAIAKNLPILSPSEKQNQGSSISQPRQNISGEIGTKLAAKTEEPLSNNTEPEKPEPAVEVPRIISSEFSLGKKNNPLFAPLKIIRDLCAGSGLYIDNLSGRRLPQNINLKRKLFILFVTAGFLVVGIVIVKKLAVINPEQRQLNTVINQTRSNLKLARTQISQNDFIGARRLLADSLSSIYAVDVSNSQTIKTAEEIYEILDGIDKTVEVSPSLLETLPEEIKREISVSSAYKDRGIALDIYEGNLYILTDNNILKITDVNSSKDPAESSAWLKSGNLPPQPLTLAVDGNIYVMNGSGTLAVYYKGEKASETNTFIVSGFGDVLLTSKDSDKLYLANKTLARIYEFDKTSLSLTRTLKVGSSEPFVDAYLLGDSTIIIVTKDGRIWEIVTQPL